VNVFRADSASVGRPQITTRHRKNLAQVDASTTASSVSKPPTSSGQPKNRTGKKVRRRVEHYSAVGTCVLLNVLNDKPNAPCIAKYMSHRLGKLAAGSPGKVTRTLRVASKARCRKLQVIARTYALIKEYLCRKKRASCSNDRKSISPNDYYCNKLNKAAMVACTSVKMVSGQ
jgi:hypothetical protein